MRSKSLQSIGLCLVLFLLGISAFAQSRRVTGRITGPDGGVPGINVVIKGTSTGTSTDVNGGFTLNLRNDADVLVISGIGYKTQEIAPGTRSEVNVTLEEDASTLNEVVVTGYTTDDRRNVTGAVSTVKARALQAVPSGNVEQQLQGRVSGLTVITNGQPGTASQVRVRGFGAFGGNGPLFVVDGVPTGNVDFLAPSDIESATVLKDAASASIYGARAANGVIIYTTRKGSKSAKKLSVNYEGQYGITDPGNGQAMLNPTEFAQWTWNAYRNSGLKPGDKDWGHPQFGKGAEPVIPDYINVGGTPGVVGTLDLAAERAKYNVIRSAGPIYQVVAANKEGTNWYKEITRIAPMQRHGLNFSGGGDDSRFYIGLSAQTQAGILKNNDYARYTFRANTEFDLSDRVRIGENLQFTYRSTTGLAGEGGLNVARDENQILGAFRIPTIIPVRDLFGGYAGTAAKGFGNPRNPVAERDNAANDRNYNAGAFGNVYAEVDPIEGLTIRSSIGAQYYNYFGYGYGRVQYENAENSLDFSYNEYSGQGLGWTLTNTANYKRRFGVHNLDVLLGQEALNTGTGRSLNGNGINPFSQDINYVTLSTVSAVNRVVGSGIGRGSTFSSVFGRVNYALNDKYIATAVVRRDGSSRFGANNRYGVFPAFSAAWRVTSEPFMKSIPWVSDLKIRGGYGTMGNSNIDQNNQYSLYGQSLDNASYDLTGSNSTALEGYYRTRIGNPNAKWETSITSNIGFDGSFFNNKLEVILDVWRKDTKDLLYQVPVADVVGTPYTSAPFVNIARMRNQGIDIQLITRGKIGAEVGYEANLTGSFLSNKIVALAGDDTYITYINPDTRGIKPIRNQLGYSISSFYGYKVVGLFQSQAEIDAAAAQTGAVKTGDIKPEDAGKPTGVGRFRFADINGTDADGNLTGAPDGKINDADRTYLGSPVPKFTGGFTLKFTYKRFDVETYGYTSLGNKIFNVSKWYTDFYPSFEGASISARVRDSWSPQNTGATIPIFEKAANFSTNAESNSYYVEDGSYFRLQFLSVGYNLPVNIAQRVGLQRVRLFASTNNLFTITKYQGLDPGVGGSADTNFGIDVGNYPVTRQVIGGINIGF